MSGREITRGGGGWACRQAAVASRLRRGLSGLSLLDPRNLGVRQSGAEELSSQESRP